MEHDIFGLKRRVLDFALRASRGEASAQSLANLAEVADKAEPNGYFAFSVPQAPFTRELRILAPSEANWESAAVSLSWANAIRITGMSATITDNDPASALPLPTIDDIECRLELGDSDVMTRRQSLLGSGDQNTFSDFVTLSSLLTNTQSGQRLIDWRLNESTPRIQAQFRPTSDSVIYRPVYVKLAFYWDYLGQRSFMLGQGPR